MSKLIALAVLLLAGCPSQSPHKPLRAPDIHVESFPEECLYRVSVRNTIFRVPFSERCFLQAAKQLPEKPTPAPPSPNYDIGEKCYCKHGSRIYAATILSRKLDKEWRYVVEISDDNMGFKLTVEATEDDLWKDGGER